MSRTIRRSLCILLFALTTPAVTTADNTMASALDPSGVDLASVHAAVVDLDSGDILYRKHEDHAVPIASVTKLMTAMVVLDSGEPLGESLTAVQREDPAPNNAFTRIRIGSRLPRGDLLRLALMSSENHAAYLLARHHPGGMPAFVKAMNAKAKALGMNDTRFVDASGLDTGNRSTAADLLVMLRAADDYARIREYSQTRRFQANFRDPHYSLYFGNTNALVYRDQWQVGLSKTGYLKEAGRCLVMVTEIDGRRLGMVLLDSFGKHSPIGDAGRIRNWLRTGTGGMVAQAARQYEQRRAARFSQTRHADASAQ
ncbi:MAG: D-alanyl-D-alanine endopeptidase [Halofilum sp. (in: g-proteobacteria)]